MKKNIFATVMIGMMLLSICATNAIGQINDPLDPDDQIFEGFEDGVMPANSSVILCSKMLKIKNCLML